LEAVAFGSPTQQTQAPTAERQAVLIGQSVQASDVHVNTARGVSLKGMSEGGIPSSPDTFLDKVMGLLPDAVLAVPPPKWCTKAVTAVLHHSSRLAKKACGRTQVAAAMQNILMKKLGIMEGHQQQSSTDFEKYLKIFKEGLTVEQSG
jgi:hypothetical protein